METIVIILSILVLLISLVSLYTIMQLKKQDYTSDMEELFGIQDKERLKEMSDLKLYIQSQVNESTKSNLADLNTFKDNLNKQVMDHFALLSKTLNDQLRNINDKVENRLSEGFKQTNQTFQNIVERLSKIDEAQKNIEKLSSEVVDLQHLLTDKKARGTFGEVQLEHILESIFGQQNKAIYDTQVTLSNNKVVDVLLHIPNPMGDLPIDSKFPLENYQKMVDQSLDDITRLEATRKFKSDVKRHVDEIANKYIILNETADQAVMFIPAEAIFAEINAYHQDLVEYAQRKRVWIASPTTIMSFLTTVQVMLRNIERDKHAKIIQEELIRLSAEFTRYKERWDKLSRSIDTVTKDVKNIHTTTEKIGKRFDEIASVDIDLIEEKNK
jgi:DNA recombination protein RmuC